MKYIRAKQAATLLLLACLIFSLVMFIGVNRSSTVLRSGHRSGHRSGFKDPALNDPQGFKAEREGHNFVIPPRNNLDNQNRLLYKNGFKKVTSKRFLFNVSTFDEFRGHHHHHHHHHLFLRASTLQNKTKQKVRKKKKLERYLIEYSPFRNNEKLREKVLVVAKESQKVNEKIWFHRKVVDAVDDDDDDDGSIIYDDGIIEQLSYVPRSYATKLQELGLTKFSKRFGHVERRDKLDKYLKTELKSIRRDLQISKTNFAQPDILRNISDKPNWNNLLKIIYLPEGLPSHDLINRDTLLHERCLVSACHLTDDPAFKEVAHAKLFQNIPVVSSPKPSGQIWVLWLLESPVNTFIINDFDMHINWTATFRRDSTIVTPYAKYLHGNEAWSFASADPDEVPSQQQQQQPHDAIKSHAQRKTKLVAWFASNCFTTNNRMEFVKELQKHVQVDVYGKCGELECNKDAKEKCYEMLSNDYKFYLAFENSNCDSYITEKLFENALENNVVPIVMGARREDYERSSPPNSFIHVDDYDTVEDLANYLKILDKDDSLYDGYLAWKGQGRFINTKFWCRLCALLQDDEKPLMWYEDIESWWKHFGTCRIGKWSLNADRRVDLKGL